MPSIVDAIKEKHPEATGSTIADCIRTSEGGGEQSVVICGINCGDYAAPDNQQHSVASEYTVSEVTEMLQAGVVVVAHIYTENDFVHEYVPFNFNSGVVSASRCNVRHLNDSLVIDTISLSNSRPGGDSFMMMRAQEIVPLNS